MLVYANKSNADDYDSRNKHPGTSALSGAASKHWVENKTEPTEGGKRVRGEMAKWEHEEKVSQL